MTHVKLMGELGEKFGSDWHMNVKTTREIFKLIDCQKEGFKDYILDCGKKGINFTAQNGEDLLDTMEAMVAPLKDTVIITPVAAGAGSSDALKIIVGAVLFYFGATWVSDYFAAAETAAATEAAAAAYNAQLGVGGGLAEAEAMAKFEKLQTYKELARIGIQSLGVGLAMSGVTGYLTPDSPSEAGDSYLFDGPANNVKQGVPVPLAYGQLIVGGSVINFGFIEERVTREQTGYIQVTANENSAAGSYGGAGGSSGGANYGTDSKSQRV